MSEDGGSSGAVRRLGLLCLLGPWRLRVDGSSVAFTPGAQRVTALVALRGPLGRAEAAAVLWPHVPATRAARRLREVLALVGGACEKDGAAPPFPGAHRPLAQFPVTQLGGRLALHPAVCVDVTAVEAAMDAAMDAAGDAVGHAAAVAAGDDRSAQLLLDAEDLLTGWYDDWVLEERARLTARRRQGLVALAVRRLRTGDAHAALEAATRASLLDPTDEQAAGAAIAAHLALGDEALALRRYLELRAVLRRELGIDPSVRLVRELRDRLQPVDHLLI